MTANLSEFLPYLLYRAAEQTSRDFQKRYQARFGMLRTEWRVLFHLGMGMQTATQVCDVAGLHKTKVSRAVQALETKRFVKRRQNPDDRRSEHLELTNLGQAALTELTQDAEEFTQGFIDVLGAQQNAQLVGALKTLISETTTLSKNQSRDPAKPARM